MKPLFVILLVVMNLFWAGSYSAYKVLSVQTAPGVIATIRYGLAALAVLLVWRWLPGRGPRGRDLLAAGLMGIIVFCVAPRLQIEGVHRGQASDASVLMALDPLVTALAAALFLRERIAPRRWLGFLLGMTGVLLLSRVWTEEVQAVRGLVANCMVLLSFVGEAAYSVIGKPLLGRCSPLKLVGAGLAAGTMANLALDLLGGHDPLAAARAVDARGWLVFAYLAAICTVVGYTLWYVVIRETEVNVTGLTVFVQPVAGLVLSVLWVGERLHWGQFWGSLVIAVGLIIGLRRNGKPRLAAPAARPVEWSEAG